MGKLSYIETVLYIYYLYKDNLYFYVVDMKQYIYGIYCKDENIKEFYIGRCNNFNNDFPYIEFKHNLKLRINLCLNINNT